MLNYEEIKTIMAFSACGAYVKLFRLVFVVLSKSRFPLGAYGVLKNNRVVSTIIVETSSKF